MLVGIMSDSHGDATATARAIAILEGLGAEHFFHCGDLCSASVLDELAGRPCTFVWGNCDDVIPTLRKYVATLGLEWPRRETSLELVGRRIAVYHGHEPGFSTAAEENGFDYIFHGHTHVCADRRIGKCRVINPGALYRANPRTCALLDLASDELTFLRIDNGRKVTLK